MATAAKLISGTVAAVAVFMIANVVRMDDFISSIFNTNAPSSSFIRTLFILAGGFLGYWLIVAGKFLSTHPDSLSEEAWSVAAISALTAILWGPVVRSFSEGLRFNDNIATFLLTGILLGGLVHIIVMLVSKARNILSSLPDSNSSSGS